ncbi:hypothetical protein [Algihabitans sp.]|uniref:hypothetical protein n=1 Tax=Algihabitans sp. TaxID=2821514 RepID=UPI003BAAB0E9
MPLFDQDRIKDLVGDHASADYELDLRGLSWAEARIAIERTLEDHSSTEATALVIRIDPATPTSGETLFLPVGRHLLEARRRGRIRSFTPLPEGDGGGFHVELPGHPDHSDDHK